MPLAPSPAGYAPVRRTRTVRRAQLRPACGEDTAALRLAVEDALNTVDFCDVGRLVLVRRLCLHGLPPRPTPGLVARALEVAWRRLAAHAVPMGQPGAERGDAVWIGSRFEARLLWLETVAGGRPVDAWFWPQALPELRSLPAGSDSTDVTPAVETVMSCALAESPGETMRRSRSWPSIAVERLVRMRTPAVLRWTAVIREAGLRPSETIGLDADGPAAAPPNLESAQQREVRRHGRKPAAPQGQKVSTGRAIPDSRPPSPPAALRATADPIAPPSATRTQTIPVTAAAPFSDRHVQHADGTPEGVAPPPAREIEVLTRNPGSNVASVASGGDHAASRARDTETRPQVAHLPVRSRPRSGQAAALPWLVDGIQTRNGGLLFLINVLRALGFDRWLGRFDSRLQRALAVALLARVLEEFGAAADDALHMCLDLDAADSDALACARFGEAGDASRTMRLWLVRIRRFLRSCARIDLHAVLLRPALLFVTPTHVDVAFPLDAADLRLRRCGFDSDPGWQPWFGRIVAFHFLPSDIWPGTGMEDDDG